MGERDWAAREVGQLEGQGTEVAEGCAVELAGLDAKGEEATAN